MQISKEAGRARYERRYAHGGAPRRPRIKQHPGPARLDVRALRERMSAVVDYHPSFFDFSWLRAALLAPRPIPPLPKAIDLVPVGMTRKGVPILREIKPQKIIRPRARGQS